MKYTFITILLWVAGQGVSWFYGGKPAAAFAAILGMIVSPILAALFSTQLD